MKSFKLLFVSALAVTFSFTSCGGDDGGSGGGNGGPGPSDQVGQKEYLEQTAQELMNEVKASDFQAITDLVKYVSDNMTRASSKKTDAVEDWFEACIDACIVSGKGTTYVKRLFEASKFFAEFTYQNGRWERTDNGNANALTFKFYDQNNRLCVATATANGQQQVHANFLDDTHKDYSTYPYQKIYYENSLVIPTQVTASLVQGSNKLAEATVNMTVSTGELYLSSSKADVKVNANVCGYNVNLSRAIYNGGNNAGLSVAVTKNGKKLVSAQAEANISLSDDGQFVSGSMAALTADVLGKVQVKANTNSISRVVDVSEELRHAETEQEFKSVVNQLNGLYEAGVYYNGSGTRQATLKLYPVKKDKYSYNGNTYEEWSTEPVIEFADGTSSTFKEFFDDEKFENLVNRFEEWLKDFEYLVK